MSLRRTVASGRANGTSPDWPKRLANTAGELCGIAINMFTEHG